MQPGSKSNLKRPDFANHIAIQSAIPLPVNLLNLIVFLPSMGSHPPFVRHGTILPLSGAKANGITGSQGIPLWGSDGEFIVNAAATKKNRPLLRSSTPGGFLDSPAAGRWTVCG